MNPRDLAFKLVLLRQRIGLSQEQLAHASGVGSKTISSFETGRRISGIRVAQLEAIVLACGMTLAEFFAWNEEMPETNSGQRPKEKTERALSKRVRSSGSSLTVEHKVWTRLLPWGS